jgi:hypothetical protein
MTTAIASFARIVNLDPPEPGQRPENKHLVAWNDEQREAAARAVTPAKPWTPAAPKPEPEIVRLRRESAAKLKQEAAQATAAASAADEEATALKHQIARQEQAVQALELRLSKLSHQNFAKQAAEARAAIKGGIENCDVAGSAPSFDRATLIILRAPEYQKIHAEAVKETEAALATARRVLADLNESK